MEESQKAELVNKTAQKMEEPEIPKAELQKVTEVFLFFEKSLKTIRIFSRDHQNTIKAKERLFTVINEFIDEYGNLSFKIKAFEFAYKGTIVYEDISISQSIPYQLFQEGFRSCTFKRGLTAEELNTFMEIIKIDFKMMGIIDEDLVTLLWKHQFQFISYYVVETLLDFTDQLVVNDFEIIFKSAKHGEIDYKRELAKFTRRTDNEENNQENGSVSLNSFEEDKKNRIFEFTEAERAELENLKKLDDPKIYLKAEQAVIYMFYQEKNEEQLLKIFNSFFNSFFERKNFSELFAMTLFFHNFVAGFSGKPEHKELLQKLKRFIDTLFSEGNLEKFFTLLNDEKTPEKEFASFISFSMKFPGIQDLYISHLPIFESNDKRKLIIKQLGPYFEKRLDELTKIINESENIEIKREFLYLLSLNNTPSGRELLMEYRGHDDPGIREEVFKVFAKRTDFFATRIFYHFISDTEETLRIKALEKLASVAGDDISEEIFSLIEDKTFQERSFREKYYILKIFLLKNGEEKIQKLQETLKLSTFIPNKKLDEGKIAFLKLIGEMDLKAAKKLVEKLAGRILESGDVKAAANNALLILERE